MKGLPAMPFRVVVRNPNIYPVQIAYHGATLDAVNEIDAYFNSRLRGHISPPFTNWPGTATQEIATGLLQRSWQSYLFVNGHMWRKRTSPIYGTRADFYRHVHEDGMVIRARNKSGKMIFEWEGRSYKVSEVYIRPKRFFSKSYNETVRRYSNSLDTLFTRTLKKNRTWRNK